MQMRANCGYNISYEQRTLPAISSNIICCIEDACPSVLLPEIVRTNKTEYMKLLFECVGLTR